MARREWLASGNRSEGKPAHDLEEALWRYDDRAFQELLHRNEHSCVAFGGGFDGVLAVLVGEENRAGRLREDVHDKNGAVAVVSSDEHFCDLHSGPFAPVESVVG